MKRFRPVHRGRLYTASKAAVTMLTTQYAHTLPGVRVNAVDPGYTATHNGTSGHQTVTEGTVPLATEHADAGTGRFVSRSGLGRWSLRIERKPLRFQSARNR